MPAMLQELAEVAAGVRPWSAVATPVPLRTRRFLVKVPGRGRVKIVRTQWQHSGDFTYCNAVVEQGDQTWPLSIVLYRGTVAKINTVHPPTVTRRAGTATAAA